MRRPKGEAVDGLDELLAGLLILKNAQIRKTGLRSLPTYSECFLVFLGKHPDGVPMLELQKRFKLTHSSTGRTCAALDAAGLVQRSVLPKDRRQARGVGNPGVLVQLTALGFQVIADVATALRGPRHRQ
jgi:MarR family